MTFLGIYSTNIMLNTGERAWLFCLQETSGVVLVARFAAEISELYTFLRMIPTGMMPLSVAEFSDKEVDAYLRDQLRQAKAPFRIVSRLMYFHQQNAVEKMLDKYDFDGVYKIEELNAGMELLLTENAGRKSREAQP